MPRCANRVALAGDFGFIADLGRGGFKFQFVGAGCRGNMQHDGVLAVILRCGPDLGRWESPVVAERERQSQRVTHKRHAGVSRATSTEVGGEASDNPHTQPVIFRGIRGTVGQFGLRLC